MPVSDRVGKFCPTAFLVSLQVRQSEKVTALNERLDIFEVRRIDYASVVEALFKLLKFLLPLFFCQILVVFSSFTQVLLGKCLCQD